jgi:hypothetical protein
MTTMDVGYSGNGNTLVRGWYAFKLWRRSRPFWGGLFTLLSALELWSIPFMQGAIHLHMQIKGVAGVSTMAIAPIMVALAVAMWFFPDYRVFAGIATLICALLSMVVSNFGGFLVGMLLALVGGSLGFSWVPRYTPEQLAAKARAEQAYRDALAGDVPAAASAPLGLPAEVPAEVSAFVADAPEARESFAAFETFEAVEDRAAELRAADPAHDEAAVPPLPSAGENSLGA